MIHQNSRESVRRFIVVYGFAFCDGFTLWEPSRSSICVTPCTQRDGFVSSGTNRRTGCSVSGSMEKIAAVAISRVAWICRLFVTAGLLSAGIQVGIEVRACQSGFQPGVFAKLGAAVVTQAHKAVGMP